MDDAKIIQKFLDCLSKGHIKMSFKAEVILKYQSEGRPLFDFKSIKFEFEGKKLISFEFASKNFSEFLLKSREGGFINMDEKAKGILEKMVADEPAGGAVVRPGAAPPPPRPAAAQVRPELLYLHQDQQLELQQVARQEDQWGHATRTAMPRPAGGAAAGGAVGRQMGAGNQDRKRQDQQLELQQVARQEDQWGPCNQDRKCQGQQVEPQQEDQWVPCNQDQQVA